MSSEDVIELGSSDEETEPARKKKKLNGNAMVEIPNKIPGLTIKPANSSHNFHPASIAKSTSRVGKSLTVTKLPKINLIANPYANKNIHNGKVTKFLPIKRINLPHSVAHNAPVQVKNLANVQIVNAPHPVKAVPVHPVRKVQSKAPFGLTASGMPIPMVKPKKSNVSAPVNIPLVQATRQVVNNKKVSSISNLPPGLTIKKTSSLIKNVTARQIVKKVPVRIPNCMQNMSNEVLTVDLDDEPASSESGPQWYIRPEDEKTSEKTDQKSPNQSKEEPRKANRSPQKQMPSKENNKSPKPLSNKPSDPPQNLEQMNNKEPDKSNFIEITIEDSPAKPVSNKGFKVGAELVITIDDSPSKRAADKTPPECSSEDDEPLENTKEPNSKKKLKYPTEVVSNVIEIEIEPLTRDQSTSQEKEIIEQVKPIAKKSNKPIELMDIVEIEESPNKPIETEQIVTPKKNEHVKPRVKMNKIDSLVEIQDNGTKEEFQPAYQTFINLCFSLENSEDMKKIVEKKIKNYYRQVAKQYTESELFTEMVLSKVAAMKAAPEKMYLYIKDIVDELDLQRKLVKTQAEAQQEEHQNFLYGKDSEFDTKRQRQIRKLEKTLKRLHRAVQKLEEQEVDFDDEEDSVYLLTDRYKERMVRVHAKLCQLTNTKMPSEPRITIEARPGQPKGPARRLEKWVNKKVPIGTPLPFPDFHDVLRCVRDANQHDKLGWNEAEIMEEGRDLFTRCGKKLQRRRQENEWRLAASRVQMDEDPAASSDDLKKKLEENTRVAAKRETEVLNKYADRQNLLKLEAVEIGDKEAEESPVESDDEETVDNVASLGSKEKRKERLKRLLHEKSKKDCSKKKTYSVSEDDNNQTGIDNKKNELQESEQKVAVELEISDKEQNEEKDRCGNNKSDNVDCGSDDSSKVESDIDELHLLQKLHSGNEMDSSTQNSTDSDSPISISDASNSSSDEKGKQSEADVISIENSTYSESEEKDDEKEKGEDKEKSDKLQPQAEKSEVPKESNEPMECSDIQKDDQLNTKDNEKMGRNKYFEEILLASDDDIGTGPSKDDQELGLDTEINFNLRDDSISIGETVIMDEPNKVSVSTEENKCSDETEPNRDTNEITDSSTIEGMEICAKHKEQNEVKRKNETASIFLEEGVVTEIMSIDSTESEEGNAIESITGVNFVKPDNKNEDEITLNTAQTDKQGANEHSSSIKAIDKALENKNAVEHNIKSIESINTFETNNKTIGNTNSFVTNNETIENDNSIQANDESIEHKNAVETNNEAKENINSFQASNEPIEDTNKRAIENPHEAIGEPTEDTHLVKTNNKSIDNTDTIENKIESTDTTSSIKSGLETTENRPIRDG